MTAAIDHAPTDTTLLECLRDKGIIEPQQFVMLTERHDTPWWLNILLAIAAWISALFIFSAFVVPFAFFGNDLVARLTGGILLLVLATGLFRRYRHVFPTQIALAFSLAGQALLISTATDIFHYPDYHLEQYCLVAVIIAALMMVPRSTPLHRSLCALIMLGGIIQSISSPLFIDLCGIFTAILASAFWLHRARWSASQHAPWFKAWAHATTFMALIMAASANIHADSSPLVFRFLVWDSPSGVPRFSLYPAGAIVLLLGVTLWLTRALPGNQRLALIAVAAACSAAGYYSPGLLTCAALVMATFHACYRPWFLIALLCGLLMLGQYYYALHITLLNKSLILIVMGSVLLGLGAGLKHWGLKQS